MYLHLGNETVLRHRDIVGIFDMETTTISKHTRQFLSDAEKGGRVVTVAEDLPKSFVVGVDDDGTETVYVAQVATATLKRRVLNKQL